MIDELILIWQEKKKWCLGLLGILLLLGLGLGWMTLSTSGETPAQDVALTSFKADEKVETFASDSVPEEKASDSIIVEIKGAVAHPGVYQLDKGSRVTDLVEKAGGLAGDANRQTLNLAAKLKDEDSLYVVREGEEVASNQVSLGVQSKDADETQVNLNTATLADLTSISGIGNKRAQDIIDYREQHGGFKTVEELKQVAGIGDKTLEKLKDSVRVD